MMAITLEFADGDYPIFYAKVCISQSTFHLNFAIVLLIRTPISLLPSAIHLFFQVPAEQWQFKFMKLVGFKQKHLNGADFIWRLFFYCY